MQPNSKIENFRMYRPIEKGEFFVVFGDTAQGGSDKNYAPFLSVTKLDFPIVFSMRGVAAEATPFLHQALQWLHDKTDVKPVFGYERNNGGASEMHRMMMLNTKGKYRLYYAKDERGAPTTKAGWDTTEISRAKMIGDYKLAFEQMQLRLYDQEQIEQHQVFVTNKRGKPEADTNMHDDAVMSSAGCYQFMLTEFPEVKYEDDGPPDQGISSLMYR